MVDARTKTLIVLCSAQVPIFFLFFIFLNMPQVTSAGRIMALCLLIFESFLLYELIGVTIQKIRCTTKNIVVLDVFDHKRIPIDEIMGLKQIVLSPMKKSNIMYPSKLFLVKTKHTSKLPLASTWWEKKGPLANKQSALGDLVKKYDESITKKLKEWYMLWVINYRDEQTSETVVQDSFFLADARERDFAHALQQAVKHKEMEFVDGTYPTFVKKNGGKYASDSGHVWETLR